MITALFSPMFVVGLGAVWAIGIPIGGGDRSVLFHHSSKRSTPVQSQLTYRPLHALGRMHSVVVVCVQHCRTSWQFGSVQWGSCLGQPRGRPDILTA